MSESRQAPPNIDVSRGGRTWLLASRRSFGSDAIFGCIKASGRGAMIAEGEACKKRPEDTAGLLLECSAGLNELPSHCVHNRLKAVVRPELLIDVVEMIAQGLRTYSKLLGDLLGTVSCCEHLQDLNFLG